LHGVSLSTLLAVVFMLAPFQAPAATTKTTKAAAKPAKATPASKPAPVSRATAAQPKAKTLAQAKAAPAVPTRTEAKRLAVVKTSTRDRKVRDDRPARVALADEPKPKERSRRRWARSIPAAPVEVSEPDPTADDLDVLAEKPVPAPTKDRGSVDERVRVRQGDSLEDVLLSHGVSEDEAQRWVTAAATTYDVRRLRERSGLTLRFEKGSRALEQVRYQIDDKAQLVLQQTPDGIEARPEGLPYYVEVRGTAGKIGRTLRDDAARVGVPDRVVATLADVFGWEADAESDGQGAHEFRVLYENIWRAGYAYPEVGRMLAAELVRGSQRSAVVFFEDADGRTGYYRPTGEAMSKAFLRYPVEFTEITSGFGWRYHPILHVGRPHKGVDFAAPTGTPIHAASDGRVVKAGWASGFGRCVKIEHLEGYVSTYGHLSGFADDLSEGSIVERGQLIGYVGATGRATGPHLHYEVERFGEAIDPLQMTAMSDQPVGDLHRGLFEKAKAVIAKQLAVLPVDDSTRIVAGTSMAAPSGAYEAE
jgi:murein DD-endopeptidase MepM/ murein hydrolase activator NlpD